VAEPEPAGVTAVESASARSTSGSSLARNSVSVASWTALSRLSGFVRIAVVAAVLGPTYLGNIFQATSSLPMLGYAALTGSLFSSLLVPGLVRRIDAADPEAVRRLAGNFLATALTGFGVAAVLLLVAERWVLRLLEVGVSDPQVAAAQERIGLVLLAMFVPQLVLYAVVGTSEAVMNAHGEFAWPNAAPIAENAGIVVTMLVTALVFGTGTALAAPGTAALLVLGLGTTGSVVLHAGLQWWGARRVGVVLLPRIRHRDPEIAHILRRAGPTLGYSTLDVLLPFAGLVVANRVAGGVLAFQFAFLLCGLPMALAARPVGVALLPRLSRRFQAADSQGFRDELVRGVSLVAFVAVPAALALVLLAGPIARSVSFGAMASPHGQELLTVAIGSLGFAVVGGVAMTVGLYALYARGDARTPFAAALLRTVVVLLGIVVGLRVPPGVWPLLTIGITISAAELLGGAWMAARLRRALPVGGERLLRPVLRAVAIAALTIAPAALLGRTLPGHLPSEGNGQVTMLAITLVALALYVFASRLVGSAELAVLTQGLRGRRTADEPA
jgi:putative peptidoglycan lipid II flippase